MNEYYIKVCENQTIDEDIRFETFKKITGPTNYDVLDKIIDIYGYSRYISPANFREAFHMYMKSGRVDKVKHYLDYYLMDWWVCGWAKEDLVLSIPDEYYEKHNLDVVCGKNYNKAVIMSDERIRWRKEIIKTH